MYIDDATYNLCKDFNPTKNTIHAEILTTPQMLSAIVV